MFIKTKLWILCISFRVMLFSLMNFFFLKIGLLNCWGLYDWSFILILILFYLLLFYRYLLSFNYLHLFSNWIPEHSFLKLLERLIFGFDFHLSYKAVWQLISFLLEQIMFKNLFPTQPFFYINRQNFSYKYPWLKTNFHIVVIAAVQQSLF